jgi:hypothetical protein
VTRRATFLAAMLVAVGRPTWWLMALATFLVRGGIVVVLLPIVTLPSVLGTSNALAPVVVPLALGRIEPAIVLVPALVVAVLLAWLIIGGRIAAGIDVALVAEAADAARDEGVGGAFSAATTAAVTTAAVGRASALGWRVVAIRLICWLPLAIAVGIGIARFVEVTYTELTRPVDVATPLVLRIAGQAASNVGLIVVAWAVGELVGGVATRRVTLTAAGHAHALAWAIGTSARSPISWLVPWALATAVLALVMGLTLGAAAFAWARAVDAISDHVVDPVATLVTMLAFVAAWLAALVLGGAILAVRSASQTFEHVRRRAVELSPQRPLDAPVGADRAGTFGAPARGRPGDWSPNDESGSL